MQKCIGVCALWLALLVVASARGLGHNRGHSRGQEREHNHKHDYKIFCYYTDWSSYRIGSGAYDISNINTTLCTHLIYAFVGITAEGDIRVLDRYQDLPDDGGRNGFGRFNALDDNNTDLTVMVSVGGWNQGSTNFSTVVNNASLRTTFVNNAIDFLVTYEFRGLEIGWSYPAQRGGVASDVQNFVLLLEELHEAFKAYGFVLTATAGARASTTATSYNVSGLAEAVDFISLGTYEYHGADDAVTGHNAPLYAAERDTTASEQSLNIDASVRNWISQGAPPSKIVLSTAAFGKSFTLEDTSLTVPGSPVTGAGTAGAISQEAGVLFYYEICQSNWTVVYDEEQRAAYAYSEDQWVSFDNSRSIREKARYLKSMELAGAALWTIDEDDFSGICGDEYPLLTTLYSELLL